MHVEMSPHTCLMNRGARCVRSLTHEGWLGSLFLTILSHVSGTASDSLASVGICWMHV